MGMYDGPKYPDQLWKLVPRFKARFFTEVIFHSSNNPENQAITKVVPVTVGVKKSTATLNKSTFKQSLEASFNEAIEKFDFGPTLTNEFSDALRTSLSWDDEKSWSTTDNIHLTISPGKSVKLMQHVVYFEGALNSDSCSLLTSTKLFESDTDEFDDEDDFIISAQGAN